MASRRLFASMSDQYRNQLRQLDARESSHRLRQLAGMLDPYRLPPEDATGWLMLLLMDIENHPDAASNLSPRICMALSNSSMGPSVSSIREAEVVRKLIDRWVHIQDGSCEMRQRMRIAMRYECQSTAGELCGQALDDRNSSPSTQVTALLCGLALRKSDISEQARARLQDDRTAHVWQLIASRQTRIRTQVRDVALAVLLQQQGIDPRTAGFDHLQADPMLVFRDHSLGFPDEASRRKSFRVAMTLMPDAQP